MPIPRDAGPRGATGATGATGAAGPNSITVGVTSTDINGLIAGNGSLVTTTASINLSSSLLVDNFGSTSHNWASRLLVNNMGETVLNYTSAVIGTLTAFAGVTLSANTLTIGTGAGTVSQTSFAANTFPARASTGNLEAKTVTDAALSVLDDTTVEAMKATLQTWIHAAATADQSVTNNAGLTNSTYLTCTIPTGKRYAFRASIFYNTTAAADLRYDVQASGVPTVFRMQKEAVGNGNTSFSVIGVDTATEQLSTPAGGGTDGAVMLEGYLYNNTGSSMTLTFRFGQNTSNAGATTLLAGSYLEYLDITT